MDPTAIMCGRHEVKRVLGITGMVEGIEQVLCAVDRTGHAATANECGDGREVIIGNEAECKRDHVGVEGCVATGRSGLMIDSINENASRGADEFGNHAIDCLLAQLVETGGIIIAIEGGCDF